VQGASDAARVQLCGTFVVELAGRRVNQALPGRQGRLLFAYLTLSRLQPVPRDVLVDALWGESPPPAAASALTVLVSKVRTAVGPDVLRGRTELAVALPEPAYVDVEDAFGALHAAESALARQDWRKAWAPALTAQFVTRRRFLPEADQPWADRWQRRLADVHARALECYATACCGSAAASCPGPSGRPGSCWRSRRCGRPGTCC
jgi:DNA-binding SARP family transcriptional activator